MGTVAETHIGNTSLTVEDGKILEGIGQDVDKFWTDINLLPKLIPGSQEYKAAEARIKAFETLYPYPEFHITY